MFEVKIFNPNFYWQHTIEKVTATVELDKLLFSVGDDVMAVGIRNNTINQLVIQEKDALLRVTKIFKDLSFECEVYIRGKFVSTNVVKINVKDNRGYVEGLEQLFN